MGYLVKRLRVLSGKRWSPFRKRRQDPFAKRSEILINKSPRQVRNRKYGHQVYLCECMSVCLSVHMFWGGAGVCGLSVYLSRGTPHRPQHFQA